MTIRTTGSRFKAPLAAAATAVTLALGVAGLAAPTASAAEPHNLVTFGDSYLSNPTPAETVGAKVRANAEAAGIPLDNPIGANLTQYSPTAAASLPRTLLARSAR